MSLASLLQFYYDTLVSFACYSLLTVFDLCQQTFSAVRQKIMLPETQTGAQQALAVSSLYVTRIVVVTQACYRVAIFFSIYEMSDGQTYCEYFYHERHFFPAPGTKGQGHVSRIEMALDLRRKALLHALRFYQDVLCHANTVVEIYTDLADYNFKPEINALLNRVRESHGGCAMEQVKHVSPNRLLHRITTEINTEAVDDNVQRPLAEYIELTRIQSAAVQLQKNKIAAFKRVIGLEKKFALVE